MLEQSDVTVGRQLEVSALLNTVRLFLVNLTLEQINAVKIPACVY